MRSRGRLLLLAFWVLPALVATLGLGLVPSRANPDITTLGVLTTQLAIWVSWGLWALAILAVGDRFPFERGRLGPAIGVHFVLFLIVVTAQIFVVSGASAISGLSPSRGIESTFFIGIRLYGDIFTVIYCAIVGANVAFRWHSAWQNESALNARLGQDLVQAQLKALQSQLNPHFLFNSLNSIVTLIGRDPPAAQKMVVRLADLLRGTLRMGDAQEIALGQELELTGRYLEIEQIRFADRLAVTWEVGSGLAEAAAPAFALQPLVENAIIHGISRRTEPGHLTIKIGREGDMLSLEVRDDGPGPSAKTNRPGAGVGLANLRSRLERLYGRAASVTLAEVAGGGAAATLRIPYRELA